MNRRIQIVALAGTVFLLVHFALTFIYATDFLVLPRTMRQVSQAYTVPFFHQSWTMFAPEVPEHGTQLEYRCYENGAWSTWQDATTSHGFGERGVMEYMEQSISSGLTQQVANNLYLENNRFVFSAIQNSYDYNKALFYCIRLHERMDGAELNDSIQLRSRFDFSPKFGSNGEREIKFLEYPAYKIQR